MPTQTQRQREPISRAADSGVDHVTICHVPAGNPDNEHTITIGEPAVDAHVENHGDTMGSCEDATSTTTTAPTSTTTTTTEAATTTTTSSTASTTSTTVVLEPTVAVSCRPTGDPTFCLLVVNLTEFAPQQAFSLMTGRQGPLSQTWQFDVMTDADGAAELVPFSFTQIIPTTFEATAGGVSSTAVPVSC